MKPWGKSSPASSDLHWGFVFITSWAFPEFSFLDPKSLLWLFLLGVQVCVYTLSPGEPWPNLTYGWVNIFLLGSHRASLYERNQSGGCFNSQLLSFNLPLPLLGQLLSRLLLSCTKEGLWGVKAVHAAVFRLFSSSAGRPTDEGTVQEKNLRGLKKITNKTKHFLKSIYWTKPKDEINSLSLCAISWQQLLNLSLTKTVKLLRL